MQVGNPKVIVPRPLGVSKAVKERLGFICKKKICIGGSEITHVRCNLPKTGLSLENVKGSNSRFFSCTNKRVKKEGVELLSNENEIRSKLIR